jgi:hypothetical protein
MVYTASTVVTGIFIQNTNSRRCKIDIYTVNKRKLIKEDIYNDESKLFIGLAVNLISTLFHIIIESFV